MKLKINTILKLNTALVVSLFGLFASEEDEAEQAVIPTGRPTINFIKMREEQDEYERKRQQIREAERLKKQEEEQAKQREIWQEQEKLSKIRLEKEAEQRKINQQIRAKAYYDVALDCFNAGKNSEAVKNFSSALAEKGTDNHPILSEELRLNALKKLVEVCEETKQCKLAINEHEDALSKYQHEGKEKDKWTDRNLKGQAYHNLGLLYFHNRTYDDEKHSKAFNNFSCATYVDEDLVEKVGHVYPVKNKAISTYYMALTYLERLKDNPEGLRDTFILRQAIKNFSEAQGFKYEEKTALSDKLRIDFWIQLGNACLEISQYKDTEKPYKYALLSNAHKAFEETFLIGVWEGKSQEGAALQNWGMVYYHQGRETKSIDTYKQAITKFNQAINLEGNSQENIAASINFVLCANSEILSLVENIKDAENYAQIIIEYFTRLRSTGNDGRTLLSLLSKNDRSNAFIAINKLFKAINLDKIKQGNIAMIFNFVFHANNEILNLVTDPDEFKNLAQQIIKDFSRFELIGTDSRSPLSLLPESDRSNALKVLENTRKKLTTIYLDKSEGTKNEKFRKETNNHGLKKDYANKTIQHFYRELREQELPDFVVSIAWRSIGRAHVALEQYSQAIEAYKKSFLSGKWYDKAEEGLTWIYYGVACHMDKKYSEAIDKYDRAINLKSNSNEDIAQAWLNKANAYKEHRINVSASETRAYAELEANAYKQVLRINPNHPDETTILAYLEAHLKLTNQAEENAPNKEAE